MAQPIDVIFMLAERKRIVTWLRSQAGGFSCPDHKDREQDCKFCEAIKHQVHITNRLANSIEQGEHNG